MSHVYAKTYLVVTVYLRHMSLTMCTSMLLLFISFSVGQWKTVDETTPIAEILNEPHLSESTVDNNCRV